MAELITLDRDLFYLDLPLEKEVSIQRKKCRDLDSYGFDGKIYNKN